MMSLGEGYVRPRKTLRARKIRVDRFLASYALALVAFLLIVVGGSLHAIAEYPITMLLCVATGGLSIYGQLISLNRDASIHFVSFVFCFLFMSAAPIAQIGVSADPIFLIDNWTAWAAMNGLAFTIIGVYITKRMKAPDKAAGSDVPSVGRRLNYSFLFLFSVTLSLVAIALFHEFLFSSRDEFARAAGAIFSDPIVSLMARTMLLAAPFFATVIGLRAAVENRHKVWVGLFSFSMLLIAVVDNPIIHPRYQLAGLVYFGIDYFFRGRRTKLLAVLVVVGVMVAPMLQVFRYEVASEAPQGGRIFDSTLLSKDYDAFQLSCYTMLTVDRAGIAWGSNILGAALFFVPRAVWTSKPEPTAWAVYETASQSTELGTSNLSTPLMAEGYFAFGWPGAILIALAYWWIITRVTQASWRDPNSWMFLSRCLFAGLVLIFLRGTLTVGVSAVAGYFAAVAIPALVLRMGVSRRGLRPRLDNRSMTRTSVIRRNSQFL